MASIRRTLSPVPRAGALMNGEVSLVASPLSKSSSTAHQNLSTSRGLLSSILGLTDSQPSVLGVSSPRTSRAFDRGKPKGQVWRRAFFHFLVCFVVGMFVGFTPFVSTNLSRNLMLKSQAISFEMVSTVRGFRTLEGMTANVTSVAESEGLGNNGTSDPEVTLADQIPSDMPVNQSIPEDMALASQKLLIVVTPTYARPLQAFYLNQLGYTLKLVQPPLLWIVVEMTSQSEQTADILRRSGVMYRHLVCKKNLTDIKDKGIHQRNVALSHIETHHLDGIVYFADDANIYATDLFEQMRAIRRFGTWAVAKVTESKIQGLIEGPICNGTRVIGWHVDVASMRYRRFHADMSGFAFNSTILWDPKRWHRPTLEPIRLLDRVRDGLQVSTFIEQIVEDESQMEGLLEDCSRIMVWRLHLESRSSFYPPKWFTISNLDVISQL
ncbi:probable beta-1,4-xylosyltransferase IRX9H [Mercurialis annua]|uniref:probable beta-1,4-xylosyltransferase IRX9H n=1 Tax=Mercurialis annua TaxID=3986 RepID=UPI00215FE4FB|nr:probable beta-1,4-xylosyltransferase IRX9H [Mercurialis annua]XP_050214030.1 probable beta-1,4-xylosyltransferase IRX9H [Mercurialis annua]XP_050214031.1 probable beta-1,4-xylosyltransferase IRX9H [Mercurialis annua]